MILFEDLGNRPLVVLRFNPDAYTDASGNKVESCFKRHSRFDVPAIANQEKWAKRLEVLKERLYDHAQYVPDQEVTIEHMFYNGSV